MQPSFGPLQARLGALVGTWRGTGDVFPNPWGPAGRSTGEWQFRADPAGLNLIHDFHETREGGGRFDGHGVFTVDPEAGDYLWFWFDTYGYPPLSPARGHWTGAALALEKHTPRGIGRSVFEVEGDTLRYRVATKLTGATDFVPVSEGMYRRVG